MAEVPSGEALTAVNVAPQALPNVPDRLGWGVAVPLIVSLSAALWAGLWYGAKAVLG